VFSCANDELQFTSQPMNGSRGCHLMDGVAIK
jgi:hypothetical protein